ncbi:MAG TPA: hypothetical protein VIF62_34410, partial [Labilithrix sp.]
AQPPPSAATKIAFAPRDGKPLASLVRSDVPELDMKNRAPATSDADASVDRTPAPPDQKSGCAGCTASRTAPNAAWLAVLAAVVASLRRLRRR